MSGDMCDCNDCDGEKDCGCGPKEIDASAGCSDGGCSVTSQSTAMMRSAGTLHPAAMRAFRGTRSGMAIAGFNEPALRLNPESVEQILANRAMTVAALSGPQYRADQPQPLFSGDDLVPGAGMPSSGITRIVPSGQAAPPTSGPGATKTPRQQSVITPNQQGAGGKQGQDQPRDEAGVTPEIAQALLGLATAGTAGLFAAIQSGLREGNETKRAEIRAETERAIANMQRQGLLSQQLAADAMTIMQNAAATVPQAQPTPPPGLSMRAKVGIGVGLAILGVGAGVAGYRVMSKDRDRESARHRP